MRETIGKTANAIWVVGGIPVRSVMRLMGTGNLVLELLGLMALCTLWFVGLESMEGWKPPPSPFLVAALVANLAGILPFPMGSEGEEFQQSLIHFFTTLVIVPLAGLPIWILGFQALVAAAAGYRLYLSRARAKEGTGRVPQGKETGAVTSSLEKRPVPKPILPKGPTLKPGELREALRRRLILPVEAEEEILNTILLLRRHQEFRQEWGLEVPTALLMVGPPGTGKTSIARFIAEAAGYPFFAVSPAEIKDMWFGESEKRLQALFREAEAVAPSVIFIDEIEAIAPSRHLVDHTTTEGVLTQLLQETEGLKGRQRPVFLLAATNIPEKVDPAMLSRFGGRLTIPLPGKEEREKILKLFLGEKARGVDLELVAEATRGWSGRDLRHLVQRVAVRLVAEGRKEPTTGDFLEGLRRMGSERFSGGWL